MAAPEVGPSRAGSIQTHPALPYSDDPVYLLLVMPITPQLLSFGAPQELASIWSQAVPNLTEIQRRSLEAGLLTSRPNLLVVAPTSSGKTFVGEMAAASGAMEDRRHSIFLVPFKALADEHFDLIKSRYHELLSIVISTGDWTEYDTDIRAGRFNLAIMTYEKLTALLVQTPELLNACTTLVVDELQLISDRSRGAGLEMLLTQILLLPHRPQIVGLSSSLRELNGLDE